ncbi:MAG: glycosyltransferase family A protein [Thermodesulfobacteriota bacterium]|nr:glycosyltransferase family A protein [Thermodesulfobacteriota bacterium]
MTPTFNRAMYLPQAIESVLLQTHQYFEYHVVDDGSTDDSRKIISPYLHDPRIHYHYRDHQGTGPSRNVGLRNAKGNFICFMDSDDLWTKDKLEVQLQLLRDNPHVDIVYGDIETMDEKGAYIDRPKATRYSGYIMDKLLLDNFVTNITAMIRRRCFDELGLLDENLPRSDDYDFYLRCSTRYTFFYHEKIYAKVRLLPGQISSNKVARMDTNKFIVERFIETNRALLSQELINIALYHLYMRTARVKAINRAYCNALYNCALAMRHSPNKGLPIIGLLKAILLKR